MENAEKQKYFHNGQWGGRKGQAAIDAPMLKIFTIKTFYLIQDNAAFTDCNAKACYNKIVAIITSLAQHKAGLLLCTCQFFIRSLKQMRYYMSMAYGQAQQYNKHGKAKPLHRIGQGPYNTQPGWDTIADIIIKCYEKTAYGCMIADLEQDLIFKRLLDMFVDDNNLYHNGAEYNLSP
eukprot:6428113-Ditylum_brightwellii.AAC.1